MRKKNLWIKNIRTYVCALDSVLGKLKLLCAMKFLTIAFSIALICSLFELSDASSSSLSHHQVNRHHRPPHTNLLMLVKLNLVHFILKPNIHFWRNTILKSVIPGLMTFYIYCSSPFESKKKCHWTNNQ